MSEKNVEKAIMTFLRENPEKTYTFREIAEGAEMGIFETGDVIIELVKQDRVNQEVRNDEYFYSLPESEKSELDSEEPEESEDLEEEEEKEKTEDSEEEKFEAREHTFIEEDESTITF